MSEMHAAAPGAMLHPERPVRLLLVDDEPDNLALLKGMLARTGYLTTEASNGREALTLLQSDPEAFDAVLLDRMMPQMDGIAVLQELKVDDRLSELPVILQTAAGTNVQVGEGLSAGAHYYLVKPFDRRQLLPIVQGAVGNYRQLREMRARLQECNPFGLIVNGTFCFRTLAEARELATWLAAASGDPRPVAFGLQALLVNAVEHGNLELGYEAKRDALVAGKLDDVLNARLANPELAARRVWVEVERGDEWVTYTIRDEGKGFDFARYLVDDESRLVDPNGRGIRLARDLSFDEVEYIGTGNTVRARAELSSWQEL